MTDSVKLAALQVKTAAQGADAGAASTQNCCGIAEQLPEYQLAAQLLPTPFKNPGERSPAYLLALARLIAVRYEAHKPTQR